MTKSEGNPKSEAQRQEAVEEPFFISASDFGIRHSFVIRHSSFVILSTFLILSLLIIQPSSFLLAATNGNLPDEIPPLMPPHAEIPPSFWEQSGQWVVLGSVVLLLVALLAVRLLNRPRPLVRIAPEVEARQALEKLRDQPEDGALLSRVSQILRRYFMTAFAMPPEELTTTEFCRSLTQSEAIGPDLCTIISGFLRQCDQRKFTLPPMGPPRLPLGAVARALQLIDLGEGRLVYVRRMAAVAAESAIAAPSQMTLQNPKTE